MITECKCPKCGYVDEDFYLYHSRRDWVDDSTFYQEYDIKCGCGCKYRYTEWYELDSTEIEEISD